MDEKEIIESLEHAMTTQQEEKVKMTYWYKYWQQELVDIIDEHFDNAIKENM